MLGAERSMTNPKIPQMIVPMMPEVVRLAGSPERRAPIARMIKISPNTLDTGHPPHNLGSDVVNHGLPR